MTDLLSIDETCDDDSCECCALWSAHNEQMRAEVERLRKQRERRGAVMERLTAERDEARAEVERLRLRLTASMPFTAAEEAIARVQAVVDRYGDDYEPEDRWRYTYDLRRALLE
jgi:hypothetical protein